MSDCSTGACACWPKDDDTSTGPEPENDEMEREYPEWYDIGEVGA